MDIFQLRTFCTVARTGSFTEAAKMLDLSQPGVSRQVQRLEQEIGGRLLVRGGRGVTLTDTGARLLEFATDTLASYDDFLSAGDAGASRLSGAIRIIASTTPGEYLAPGLVAAFSSQNPGVNTEVFVADSALVAGELLEGRWDVGFTGLRAADSKLVHYAIASDEIVLAAPVSHRFANEEEIDVAALAGERLIQREDGSGTQATVRDALRSRGASLPEQQAAMSLGSTQAIVQAVDSGLGVGFVTLRALEAHRAARVAAVRMKGGPIMRDLYMIYEPARRHSEQVRAFIDFTIKSSSDK